MFPLHGLGGLERHVYDLVRYLAEAGVETTLVTRTPKESHAADEIHPRITLATVPYRTFPLAGRRGTTVIDRSTAYPLFGLRAGRLAWQLVRDGKIDIVHGLGASVLGYARRRATSAAPLVLNPQGLEEFGATNPRRARLKRAGYLPLRRAVRICAKAADRIIATDRALEPIVRQHLHVPAERVRVIPNALDLRSMDRIATAADAARVRLAAGIGRDDVVLLSVGRIEENKGFHHLAAALGALAAHGGRLPEGRWRWVIVGDGPFRGRLEQAIREANLGSAALLAGRLEDKDLHAWYETATLFVHPTLYEGSSLVTLEAMAHRRAVVATQRGRPARQGQARGERVARRARGCVRACRRDQRRDRYSPTAHSIRAGRTSNRGGRVLVGCGGTGDGGALQGAARVARRRPSSLSGSG